MQESLDNLDKNMIARIQDWFVGLSLRYKLVVVLAIVFFASGVLAAVIGGGSGANMYFSPTGESVGVLNPGDTLSVDVMMDSGQNDVIAVAAVINFDPNQLDIACNDVTCSGVVVGPSFTTTAELKRNGGQIRIVAGNSNPIRNNGVVVATLSFTVRQNAVGVANLSFDRTDSSIVINDGLGTNILDTVTDESYLLSGDATGSLIISNIGSKTDTSPSGSCGATITWNTNMVATSRVDICEGDANVGVCGSGNAYTASDGAYTSQHSLYQGGLACDKVFFYTVTSENTRGLSETSETFSFYTGAISPMEGELEIQNLAVDAGSRSAVITWNTSKLSDSKVSGLSPSNGFGVSDFSDSTFTLTHSIRISNLRPEQTYSGSVISSTGTETKESQFVFTTKKEDLTLDANYIVRARRDRVCASWLKCSSSVTVESPRGEKEDLCFDFALCDKLDPDTGECLNIVRPPKSTQTFKIVKDKAQESTVDKIRFLSGLSVVGADWQGFVSGDEARVEIPGYYPYSRMEQVGSSLTVPNGDFEIGNPYPWRARFYPSKDNLATLNVITDRSNLQDDLNKVLSVQPVKQVEGVSGVKVPLGNNIRPGRQYYVSFDIKSDVKSMDIIVQLGYGNYTLYNPAFGSDVINVSNGWQKVIAGPLEPTEADLSSVSGQTYLGFLYRFEQSESEPFPSFYIDNVSIQPVLNVAPNVKITKTCRSYATNDAPSCRFFDINSGREYQGWEGFCVETDPRNPRRCIQWLPIDVIAGSQGIRSTNTRAGYNDRQPLYYCTKARGNAPYVRDNNLVLDGYCKRDNGWFGAVTGFSRFGVVGALIGWELDSGNTYSGVRVPGGGEITTNTSGRDGFLKEDLERVVIRYFFARDDDSCTFGGDERVIVLDPKNGFSATDKFVINPEKSEILTVRVTRLDDGSYEIYASATNDGASGTIIKMYMDYYLREWCQEISQVVDPFGENSAWARRIQFNSVKELDLGYDRGQDYAPFGAIVPPQQDYDPGLWDSSPDELGIQPLYVEPPDKVNFPIEPYQARAGSPYGVEVGGTVDAGTCITGDEKRLGLSCRTHRDCGVDLSTGFTGRCTGVITPNNQTEDEFIEKLNNTKGELHISELFARSVGVWSWDVSEKRYVQTCTEPGTCTKNVCDNSVRDTILCDAGSGDPCGEFVSYRKDPFQICYPDPNTCWDTYSEVQSTCSSTKTYGWNIINKERQCTKGQVGKTCYTSDSECDIVDTNARCMEFVGGVCLDGPYGGQQCNRDSECPQSSCGLPLKCQGGRDDGKVCSGISPNECVGGVCDIDQTYFGASKYYCVGGPKDGELCSSDLSCQRIEGVCSEPEDQSIFPPFVENITVKSGTQEIKQGSTDDLYIRNGQGGVSITFTSNVSPEQVPLTRYTVDWGDGKTTEESSLKIAPKSSEDSPHVLAHTYFCDDDINGDGVVNVDDYTDNNGVVKNWDTTLNACVFKPMIQIEDNWGWCSGQTLADGSPISVANKDNYSGGKACESWDVFTGRIVVCPDGNSSGGCNNAPFAVIKADTSGGRSALTVTFDGSGSADPDGDPITYLWDFGDPGCTSSANCNTSTLESPQHVYASDGTYYVTLTVTDDKGASNTSSQFAIVVTPNQAPVASIATLGGVSGFEPFTVTFDGSGSADPDGDPISYLWDFGDPGCTSSANCNTSTLESPQHVYERAGTYTAQLTVYDDRGLASSPESITITVNPNAGPTISNISVNPASGNIPFTVTVSADIEESTKGNDFPVNVVFDFGDGISSSAPALSADGNVSQTHTYTNGGVHTITITATDSGVPPEASQGTSSVTVNTIPNRPTNLTQSPGTEGASTFDTTPSFSFRISDRDSWNTSQLVGYRIQISRNAEFTDITKDYTWTGSTTNPNNVTFNVLPADALSNGSYWWRVATVDDQSSQQSEWAYFGDRTATDFIIEIPPFMVGYNSRRQITVTNNESGNAVPRFYPVKLQMDTSSLGLLPNGSDLRVAYVDGNTSYELNRVVYGSGTQNTQVWFGLERDIPAGGTSDNYWVFYGNSSAGSAPEDKSMVFDPRRDSSGSLGHFSFEEGSGNQVRDIYGKAPGAGTFVGSPQWMSGKWGGGLYFTGSDRINIPGSFGADYWDRTPFTYEAWVKPLPPNSPDDSMTIIHNDAWQGFGMRRLGVDEIVSAAINSTFFGDGLLASDTWSHVAVSFQNGVANVYVNGTRTQSVSNTGNPIWSFNQPGIEIGGARWGVEYFRGYIDEVRISGTAYTSFPYARIRTEPTLTMGSPIVIAGANGQTRVAGASTTMYRKSYRILAEIIRSIEETIEFFGNK